MRLENSFVVPVELAQAWTALNDPERVAPCFPGATLDSVDGDTFTGTVKLKLGPISMLYKGTGTFVERNDAEHRVVIDATGRDSRGGGQAKAKVTGTLRPDGAATAVTMVTELTITGKPAQLGRGIIAEVSNKIVDQFAGCLAETLGGPGAATPAATAAAGAAPVAAGAAPAGAAPAAEPPDAAPPDAEPPDAAPPDAAPTAEPPDAEPPDTSVGGPPAAPPAGPSAAAAAPGPLAASAEALAMTSPGLGLPPSTAAAEATVAAAVPDATPAAAAPAAPAAAATAHRRSPDAIDLVDTAGAAVAKRLIPAFVIVALIVAVAIWLMTR